MKAPLSKPRPGAFTLIELLVMIVTVALVCVLIPTTVRRQRLARLKTCENNLKQVGLAFRYWDLNGGGEFVMAISTNYGGSKEQINTGRVFVHFRPMSNQLITPKVLVCPQDAAKTVAAKFSRDFSDTNVSYFVSVDALDLYPRTLLSGDRNLGFDNQPLKPGLFTLTTNNPTLSWTKALHNSCGNVLFADSSVQFLGSKQLATAARDPEGNLATNRLAIP